jgi:hypothetical protein
MKTTLTSIFSALTILTISSSNLFASESIAILSKGATTLTVTGTVYPDTPEGQIYGAPVSIVAVDGGVAGDASVEIGVSTSSIPEGDSFTAYILTISLNAGAIPLGPFTCAKQTGTNHIIKLPDGFTSLDTGDTVFTVEAPNFTIDISGLLFVNTSNNLQATVALTANDVKHSLLESVVFRGDKIALISADNREKEYDFSLAGVSGTNLKKLCREVAHSVSDRKVTFSGTVAGKVTLQLEID